MKNPMVIYNAATRELSAKIVYYGPGLGGKTTNLHLLHERLEPATVGKLLNLATQTDRTIYFDLLPVELGDIKGYKIRFQLATVPGQTAFNETRRVVLKGTDGIVFVADSQWTMLPKNLESWQNLKDNLKANGVSFEGIPIVVQYNKRDLTDILAVDALQEALGLSSYPFVEAVASAGRGVTETFKLISKLTFVDLLRRLQGKKPGESAPTPRRREADDLLSWKDSLLSQAPAGGARPTPSPQSRAKAPAPFFAEEAPFDTGDAPEPAAEPAAADPDAPFGNDGSAPGASKVSPPARVERAPAPPARAPGPPREPAEAARPAAGPLDETNDRIRAIEARVEEAIGQMNRDREDRQHAREEAQALAARLEACERDASALGRSVTEKQRELGERVDDAVRQAQDGAELESRIGELQERLGAGEKRQRTAEDDVSISLASLSERGEKFHQQIDTINAQLEVLEAALREKTAQSRREADDIRSELESLRAVVEEKVGNSRREAEDIRTQIGPLLEARDQRAASDERLSQEFERLRESIAESLGDLSERLRRAVRGA